MCSCLCTHLLVMSVPNSPTAAVTTINPTNATITITVSSIAYTRETYYILYSGVHSGDTAPRTVSDTDGGTADIMLLS